MALISLSCIMHRFTAFRYLTELYVPRSLALSFSLVHDPRPRGNKKQRKKERKIESKKKRRGKNIQGRTLTSAACNIPYGRSSVIFSGKSVAAFFLSLFLSLSLSLSLWFFSLPIPSYQDGSWARQRIFRGARTSSWGARRGTLGGRRKS